MGDWGLFKGDTIFFGGEGGGGGGGGGLEKTPPVSLSMESWVLSVYTIGLTSSLNRPISIF